LLDATVVLDTLYEILFRPLTLINMSKVNIEKSKLTNSPITVDSFNKENSKKNFLDNPYIKYLVLPIIVGLLVLFIWSIFSNQKSMPDDKNQPKVNIKESQLENSPVIVDSPGATVSISATYKQIQSISVEAKLLGTKKVGIKTPPSSVDFTPIGGGSNAKLGNETLVFQSPVFFNTTNSEIEVINNFALQPGSQLQHQELENIKKIQTLTVPIVTVVYGNAIETMKKLSISMKINGKVVFSKEWAYNVAFQHGPTFSIPLEWKTIEEPK